MLKREKCRDLVIYGQKVYSITIHINKNKFIEKEDQVDQSLKTPQLVL